MSAISRFARFKAAPCARAPERHRVRMRDQSHVEESAGRGALLLVRAGERLYGLSLSHVSETMRPLPIESLPNTPDYVLGVSVVRGQVVPIVDLRALFGGADGRAPGRLISLRLEDGRSAGLLVDAVLGVQAHVPDEALPPLLEDARADVVQSITRIDGQLLTVLRAGRFVGEAVYAQLDRMDV